MNLSVAWVGTSATSWCPNFDDKAMPPRFFVSHCRIAHDKWGLHRILVTCDDDNIGSIRTIEKNGGILENVVDGPDLAKPIRRYWIELR